MTAKVLADGQLPNAKGTLYTVPGATQTIIKQIKLVNTNTTTPRTVNLYIKKSGSTSRRIMPTNMSLGAKFMWDDKEAFELGAADLVEGDADAATEVDYIIMGVEKT